jgi:hypothetical protein
MLDIHRDPKPLKLMYFWIGILATFGYRLIIVLNFYDPLWVKIVWYIGTIGFIIYFWSRYRIVRNYSKLIREQELVKAVRKASNITTSEKEALSYIIGTLSVTKAQVNYVIIFILSALALLAGFILDFLV